jgi:hypothetical protein
VSLAQLEVLQKAPQTIEVYADRIFRDVPASVDVFPTEIHEETAGVTAWSNPKNILDADADVATVTGGGSGKIAGMRLAGFKIGDYIPEGSELLSVKAIYKARRVVKGEGNPITGILVKTGSTTVTAGGTYVEAEGEAVPTVLTEVVIDLTSHGWTITELEDGAPLYIDIRCRNNSSGKTSEFEWQYAGFRIGYLPPAPGSLLLLHEDPMGTADTTVDWGEPISGPSATRYTLSSTGGDTRPRLDGSPAHPGYRQFAIEKGDRAPGDGESVERLEAGHLERRYGIKGGPGTFLMLRPGMRLLYQVSYWLDPSFEISTKFFNLLMQIKQGEPFTKTNLEPNPSPILALQARENQGQIIAQPDHNEEHPLWTYPITTGRWITHRWDLTGGSETEGTGLIRLQIDDRTGSPTDFVAEHDSGTISHPTLAMASGVQTGSASDLAPGDPIPGVVRAGIYRDSRIGNKTSIRISGVHGFIVVP